MKALGEFLRKARETKGLSLQEVQEVTKIRLFFLESIENGDFDVLPGKAYIKGFLRNYAAAVGIPEQEVIDRFNQLNEEQTRTEATPAEQIEVVASAKVKVVNSKEPKAPKVQRPTTSNQQKNLILPAVIIVFGIIAGVYISGLIIRPDHKDVKPVTTTVAHPKPVIKPKSVDKVAKPSSQFADVVRLEATEDVWIRLTESDTGRMIEEVRLKKGDTRQWKLHKAMTLLNGNAGGLLISDKGEAFKYRGNKGEVVTLTFSPNVNE